MQHICKLLTENHPDIKFSQQQADLSHYGQDWTRQWTPKPCVVVFPESYQQVQNLVRFANLHKIAVVPSGGRTGLSGGAVANNGEIVLSLERLNKVIEFDEFERTLTVQAGMVTEQLQRESESRGLYYPVDFASRGSSQIGGNIATNAGGIKVLRYGMTRDWIVGLKVVTGTGELIHCNKNLAKNATGYDFRHLMIGSEGTLGIVVEASIKLTAKPMPQQVMVLAVPTLEALMPVFNHLRAQLKLSAFEFFTEKALAYVVANGGKKPFESASAYYVLAEFDENDEASENAFAWLAEQELVVDGVKNQSLAQAAELWKLREGITESIAKYVPYKNDISVRISRVGAFMAEMNELFAKQYPNLDVIWFGHLGDGNLHISVLKPEEMAKQDFISECERVTSLLCETLNRYEGSISAEHGVGLLKRPYLSYSRSEHEIELMWQIKKVFDPNAILNPGKLLPNLNSK